MFKDLLDPSGVPRSKSYSDAKEDAEINPATARYQISSNLFDDYVDIANRQHLSVNLCSADRFNEMQKFSFKSEKEKESWFENWFKKFPDINKL